MMTVAHAVGTLKGLDMNDPILDKLVESLSALAEFGNTCREQIQNGTLKDGSNIDLTSIPRRHRQRIAQYMDNHLTTIDGTTYWYQFDEKASLLTVHTSPMPLSH